MITRSELSDIGYIAKTHGVSGEMKVVLSDDVELDELSCIVLDMDGIFVPFFLEGVRPVGSDGCLVMIDGIDSESEAEEFVGKTVYALNRELPETEDDEDGLYAEDMIGFRVTSIDGKLSGEVTDVDTATENVLLVVRTDEGKQVLIPLADEMISILDPEERRVEFDLPEGLLNLKN